MRADDEAPDAGRGWTKDRLDEAWAFRLKKLVGDRVAVVLEDMPTKRVEGGQALWLPPGFVADSQRGAVVPARVVMCGSGRTTLHGARIEVTDVAQWDRVLIWYGDFQSYSSNTREGTVAVAAILGVIEEDERSLAHLAALREEG